MPVAAGILRPGRSIGVPGPAPGSALLDAKDLLYVQQRLARAPCHTGARLSAVHTGSPVRPALLPALRPSQRPGSNSLARAHGVGCHAGYAYAHAGYAYAHTGCADAHAAGHHPCAPVPANTGGYWRATARQAEVHAQTRAPDTSWHETQVDPGDVPHTVLLACMEQVRTCCS